MKHDTPATQDEFGRRSFATQLARALSAPRQGAGGFVVALDGAWGSGKTTLLNWIKEDLEISTPAPVVLEFNPWRISGLDALIETYLIELATRLETPIHGEAIAKGAEVGQRIVNYLGMLRHLRHLKYVPSLGFLGNIAEGAADYAEQAKTACDAFLKDTRETFGNNRGIEGAKSAIEAALDELDCGVVVILDDLDRLNREEIRTIFQLIKSTADFRHITYLLAFDAGQVARALDEEGNVADGMQYLEKIIQATFRIPPCSRGRPTAIWTSRCGGYCTTLAGNFNRSKKPCGKRAFPWLPPFANSRAILFASPTIFV
ncbi:hypothetical protein EZJ19_12025 [Parasulfuritortus cantonensis]|uniref:KAP NTPase domain-containing protein n=1 Tax=Parasulfuritortus cantonensis TaxID=2528202 RepID=A0A4V2NVC1_9PROT|nr:P-loop NTPase fold protein [Parasulfuritortus cantonensis]TCJ12946.1 hypothetical protein EZJ19_12025 [Parasulfuritortus cantonensis]